MTTLENKLDHLKKHLNTLDKNLASPKFDHLQVLFLLNFV